MTSPPPSPARAADISPLSVRVSQLRAEIASLTALLAEQASEERDVQQQIESLTYATDLTRDEAHRRARANEELANAYKLVSAKSNRDRDPQGPDHRPQPSVKALHALERDLFHAKGAAAAATFEAEQVEFKLKKIKERLAADAAGRRAGRIPADVASPSTPVMRSSPQITSLSGSVSSGGVSKRKMSPLVRPTRLIGDVDCLLAFADDAAEVLNNDNYAPCRLGVTANGHMAVYSYASAIPQLELDDRSAKTVEIGDADVDALRDNLSSVDLQIGASEYCLSGLREAVNASMQLVQDATTLLKADDENILPTGDG